MLSRALEPNWYLPDMRPCTSATELRVISCVTSSPSLAKKPLSMAIQIGRLVAPAKVTMVSLVCAQAGAARLRKNPIAANRMSLELI